MPSIKRESFLIVLFFCILMGFKTFVIALSPSSFVFSCLKDYHQKSQKDLLNKKRLNLDDYLDFLFEYIDSTLCSSFYSSKETDFLSGHYTRMERFYVKGDERSLYLQLCELSSQEYLEMFTKNDLLPYYVDILEKLVFICVSVFKMDRKSFFSLQHNAFTAIFVGRHFYRVLYPKKFMKEVINPETFRSLPELGQSHSMMALLEDPLDALSHYNFRMPDYHAINGKSDFYLLCRKDDIDDETFQRVLDCAHFIINIPNETADQSIPLHALSVSGSFFKFKRLVQLGACLDYPDNKGRTALHLTVMSGHLEKTNFLMQQGAFLDVQDSRGDSPLHYAVKYLKKDCLIALIQQGALKDIKNKKNKTPQDMINQSQGWKSDPIDLEDIDVFPQIRCFENKQKQKVILRETLLFATKLSQKLDLDSDDKKKYRFFESRSDRKAAAFRCEPRRRINNFLNIRLGAHFLEQSENNFLSHIEVEEDFLCNHNMK